MKALNAIETLDSKIIHAQQRRDSTVRALIVALILQSSDCSRTSALKSTQSVLFSQNRIKKTVNEKINSLPCIIWAHHPPSLRSFQRHTIWWLHLHDVHPETLCILQTVVISNLWGDCKFLGYVQDYSSQRRIRKYQELAGSTWNDFCRSRELIFLAYRNSYGLDLFWVAPLALLDTDSKVYKPRDPLNGSWLIETLGNG